MRIAPHVVVTAHEPDETELIRRVIADGVTTHGHPRALLGGVLHALALRHALRREQTLGYGELLDHLRGDPSWRNPQTFINSLPADWYDSHAHHSRGDTHQPPDHLWDRTCKEVQQLLNTALSGLKQGATANDQRTLTDLGVYDKHRSGAGTVTAVAAAYIAARTASRPMGGLLRSGFLRNADTDTLCSMTGALLGATQGTGWMADLFALVQDREYLIDTATVLAGIGGKPTSADPEPSPKKPPTTAANRRWVKALFEGDDIQKAPDGRPARVRRIEPLHTRTKQFVARAVLEVADGQTLIVDRISKTPIPTVSPNHDAPTGIDRPTRDETESPRGPSTGDASTGGKGATTVAAVELRVADVAHLALFLHSIFGLPATSRPNERVDVGTSLVLAPASNVDTRGAPLAVLHLHSNDLRGIAGRAEAFDGAAVQWTDDGKVLWIREPHGLRIRVSAP